VGTVIIVINAGTTCPFITWDFCEIFSAVPNATSDL